MKLRTRIFNWFADGYIHINSHNILKEKTKMAMAPMNMAGQGITLGGMQSEANHILNSSGTVTIKLTPATGGTIVGIIKGYNSEPDLYIIPNNLDFDNELGKIITMSNLKQS